MQDFIARENIMRFEARLRRTSDEGERRLLRQLIRQEEQRLEAFRAENRKDRPGVPRTDPETTR